MSSVLAPQIRKPESARSPLSTLRAMASGPTRKRRPKLFYASVAMVIVFGTIVAQIALSVMTSSNAFEIDALQTANKTVSRTYEQVKQTVAELSSPQHLAFSAEKLGMVSSSTPAYLRLSDGKIIGHPTRTGSTAKLLNGSAVNLVPNAKTPDLAEAVKSANASVAVIPGVDGSVALPAAADTIPAPTTR